MCIFTTALPTDCATEYLHKTQNLFPEPVTTLSTDADMCNPVSFNHGTCFHWYIQRNGRPNRKVVIKFTNMSYASYWMQTSRMHVKLKTDGCRIFIFLSEKSTYNPLFYWATNAKRSGAIFFKTHFPVSTMPYALFWKEARTYPTEITAMLNLPECEWPWETTHDTIRGLLCCQGVFPNNSSGAKQIFLFMLKKRGRQYKILTAVVVRLSIIVHA